MAAAENSLAGCYSVGAARSGDRQLSTDALDDIVAVPGQGVVQRAIRGRRDAGAIVSHYIDSH